MSRTAAVVLLAVAAVAAGCSPAEQRVTGIVIAVDADLTAVRSFTVQAPGGPLEFRPGAGPVHFEHGAPLIHLTDHLRSGGSVRVTFTGKKPPYRAISIEDVGD